MKTQICAWYFATVLGVIVLGRFTATAAEQVASPVVQVSANVAEVLKLAHAQVNDDVIVAFVGSSKRTYILGANEIVYLRQQGVSDRVITAMLDHHAQLAEVRTASASPIQSNPAPAAATITTTTYVAPAYVAPSPSYAYPAPAYGYYDYPYYRSYWGFPWPALSLSFGFGHWGGHHHHH